MSSLDDVTNATLWDRLFDRFCYTLVLGWKVLKVVCFTLGLGVLFFIMKNVDIMWAFCVYSLNIR